MILMTLANWKVSGILSSLQMRDIGMGMMWSRPQQQISWHTNFFEDYDDNQLREGSIVDHCLEEANEKHIKPHEQGWFDERMPQFASVVLSPPIFNNMTHYWHVIFNIVDMKNSVGAAGIPKRKRHQWMRKELWLCDGAPATPLGRGCPNGETLVIRCPQMGHEAAPNVISIRNDTYYIGDHIACYRNHTFAKPKPNGIAANALLFGDALKYPRRLVEWVEYHRMIGVDHFFIYYMGNYSKEEELFMPNLPYMTYIPYDLMHSSKFDDIRGAFRFQVTQQMDAIFRARGLGYSWILMHDMDEYIQFIDPSETLRNLTNRFLYDEYGNYTKLGGVSIQSTTYGAAHGEPKFPELMIDHIWKRRGLFVGERQKAFVRPMNVNYFAVHGVTMGGKVVDVDPAVIRLDHYRHPELGVSLCKKPGEDRLLRDLWHDRLKQRVDHVWNLMKEKYDSPNEIWRTDYAFRNYHSDTRTGHHSVV